MHPKGGVDMSNKKRTLRGFICAAVGLVLSAALPHADVTGTILGTVKDPSGAAAAFGPQEHYAKFEYRIPMRDGTKLFTAVYVPKDGSGEKYPFLLMRTPYSVAPYGVDRYRSLPEDLGKAGYIFVFQDVRGRGMSEGTFIEESPCRDHRARKTDFDESTDTFDTVEWLLSHVPNNNGRVGIWGFSYDGFYAEAGITDTHPAIKAADIEVMGDWNYQHGTFRLFDNFTFYVNFRPQNEPAPPAGQPFSYGTPDAYDFFLNAGPLSKLDALYFQNPNLLWTDQLRHSTYDDYWKERDLLAHLRNIHCAVLNVSSWFDQYSPQGGISFYHTIKKNNPEVFDELVVGPWSHGGALYSDGHRLGDIDFNSDTAIYYREHIRLPFFEHYLKERLPSFRQWKSSRRERMSGASTRIGRRPKPAIARSIFKRTGPSRLICRQPLLHSTNT